MERHHTMSLRLLSSIFVFLVLVGLWLPNFGGATLPGRNGKLYFTIFPRQGGTEIAWIDVGAPRRVHIVRRLIGVGIVGWAPGGKRIAYAAPNGIFVANPDGSERHQLTVVRPGSQTFDGDPRWSPDGRWLVFAHEDPVHPSVQLIRPDGTGRRRLTAGDAPLWSPTGREVAFQFGRFGEQHIFAIGVDGRGRRQITNSPATETLPDWSPDGRQIVFVSDRAGTRNGQIYVVSAAGSSRAVRIAPSAVYDTTPGWSPDGRWVVFARGERLKSFSLYLVHPNGTGLRRLTDGSLNVQLPQWQSLPLQRR